MVFLWRFETAGIFLHGFKIPPALSPLHAPFSTFLAMPVA
jgi:hypothetical protein